MRKLLIILEMIREVRMRGFIKFQTLLEDSVIGKELPETWKTALATVAVDYINLAILLQLILITHFKVIVGWHNGFRRSDLEIHPDAAIKVTTVIALLQALSAPLPKVTLTQALIVKWQRLGRKLRTVIMNNDILMTLGLVSVIIIGSTIVITLLSFLIFVLTGGA